MKLLALLIGLLVERLATQLFHLRELRWLDRIIDKGFGLGAGLSGWQAYLPVLALAFLLVLPILLIRILIGDEFGGVPYFVLAIIVLFFSLGPKDIGEEVDEYCSALEADDEQRIIETSAALLEAEVPLIAEERIRKVEEAVCVEANNRLFAVIFWFVLFGPLGAWSYRVTDLIRRRAVFLAGQSSDAEDTSELQREAIERVHGLLAWIPARLTAAVYGMAGSFDGAKTAWKTVEGDALLTLSEHSERLLARVGTGALLLETEPGETDSERGVRGATAANGLVFRSLVIWAVVIGVMTLHGSFA
jgi:AmpE protein